MNTYANAESRANLSIFQPPRRAEGIALGLRFPHVDCCGQRRAGGRSLGPETSDSERGWTTFRRSVRGLQRWLNAQWTGKKGYSLGEWHYHPSVSPVPRPADLNQMKSLSHSSSV